MKYWFPGFNSRPGCHTFFRFICAQSVKLYLKVKSCKTMEMSLSSNQLVWGNCMCQYKTITHNSSHTKK